MGSGPTKVLSRPITFTEGTQHQIPYPSSTEPYWTVDKSACRPIRYAAEGMASEAVCPASTVPRIIQKCVEINGARPALRTERPCPAYDKKLGRKQAPSADFKEWKTWTFKQYYDECHLAARGMLALGLQRYDGVNIYGFNCPEWLMAQNAGIMAGGIAAGIYPSDTPAQVTYKAKHSGASIAVCQPSKAQMFIDAFRNGDLPKLKAVVVWGQEDIKEEKFEGKTPNTSVVKLSWSQLVAKGRELEAGAVDKIIDSLQSGDTACLIYTSGTTGKPKAVMISHDNILFESQCALSLIKTPVGEERVVSYLPLSHVAGCMLDIIMPLVVSSQKAGVYGVVGFARVYDLSKGSFGDRLRAIKPTMFLGVPRVWEKIQAQIMKVGATLPDSKKWLSGHAKAIGLEHALNCQLGGSGEIPNMHSLAGSIVFDGLKKSLGLDECTFAMTGAAPITRECLQYFGQLGLQINEVYGMSECTGATTWSSDEAHIWGSCGWKMPGTEVKVFRCSDSDMNDKKECPKAKDIFNPTEEEQGEICFRGRHIMKGYMANPDFGDEHVALIKTKNSSAIDTDGWLHSGDKGCVGENGMFKITGRYKELIIGSGGENIAPVPIEDNIKKLCPAISNIMMVGEKKKYNTALVTLKAVGATGELPGSDELDSEAVMHGSITISSASSNHAYIKMITDAIVATNNNGKMCPSNASKIQKFSILPQDFSVSTGELTPTLKLKRSAVMKDERYQDVIARLYAPENKAKNYVPFYTGTSDRNVKAAPLSVEAITVEAKTHPEQKSDVNPSEHRDFKLHFTSSTEPAPAWLAWEFHVGEGSEHVEFGLYYSEVDKAPEAELIPLEKVSAAANKPFRGCWRVSGQPGVYILRWGNTMSYWSSKHLFFKAFWVTDKKPKKQPEIASTAIAAPEQPTQKQAEPQAEDTPAEPQAEDTPAEPQVEDTPAEPQAEDTPAEPQAEAATPQDVQDEPEESAKSSE